MSNNTATSQKLTNGAGLIVTAAVFIAVLLLSNVVFSGMRADLTENKLYTLSDGTKSLLSKIEEPIHLRFYFSKDVARNLAPIRSYGQRVEELLEEFVAHSDGKLRLSVVNPEPFSEEEDEAAGFGLVSAPVGATNEKLYMGLAATNTVGDQSAIVFFQTDREAFLEYEISKMLYDLANPQKRVVGLLGSLPLLGAPGNPQTGQPQQDPWIITQQLQQFFEVKNLGANLANGTVPDDVDVLLIAHPKDFTPDTRYGVDQYVLKGGKAAIFVDPFAERDPGDPMDPMAAGLKFSQLNRLFRAWGFEQSADKIIADQQLALPVQVQPGRRPVSHLALLGAEGEAINRDEVMTADLESVNFGSAAYFTQLAAPVGEDGEAAAGIDVEFIPLIQSTEFAQPIAASRMNYLPDPTDLMRGFAPTGERYTLAARIHGNVKSAYPEKAAEGVEGHVDESVEPINVIVVADSDVLSDRLWVQIQNLFGQQIASTWASNGDFVINALDTLSGSQDLISIRSRGTFNRPFDKVVELRRNAELAFQDKEQALEAELRETERKLSELQGGAQIEGNRMTLSPEQQEAIEEFQDEQLRVRKELRDVRHQLDKDIKDLGFLLEMINTLAIPVLIILLAIFLGLRRSRASA